MAQKWPDARISFGAAGGSRDGTTLNGSRREVLLSRRGPFYFSLPRRIKLPFRPSRFCWRKGGQASGSSRASRTAGSLARRKPARALPSMARGPSSCRTSWWLPPRAAPRHSNPRDCGGDWNSAVERKGGCHRNMRRSRPTLICWTSGVDAERSEAALHFEAISRDGAVAAGRSFANG